MREILSSDIRVIPLSIHTPGIEQNRIYPATLKSYGNRAENLGNCIIIPDLTHKIALQDEGCLFTHPIIKQFTHQRSCTDSSAGSFNLWIKGDKLYMQSVSTKKSEKDSIHKAPLGDEVDLSNKPLNIITLNDDKTEVVRIEEWAYWGGKAPFQALRILKTAGNEKTREPEEIELFICGSPTDSAGRIEWSLGNPSLIPDDIDQTYESMTFLSKKELLSSGELTHRNKAASLMSTAFFLDRSKYIELILARLLPNYIICNESEYVEILQNNALLFTDKR
jgi:hypothetical protein